MKTSLYLSLFSGLLLVVCMCGRADDVLSGVTVKLWDVGTGKEIDILASHGGHGNDVTALAFSPDGKLLASASRDRRILLRDAGTGMIKETLAGEKGHKNDVTAIAFSLDSALLASGGADRAVKIWEIKKQGVEPHTLEGHEAEVTSVAFSPDGRMLASGSSDGTVRLWDVNSTKILAVLKEHNGPVNAVAFSKEGILASGSLDKTIRLWDLSKLVDASKLASFRILKGAQGHSSGITALCYSLDGKQLASGSDDDTIKVWDGVTDKPLHTLIGHSSAVTCVAFNKDGVLASGSWDSTVKLWDLRGG
jgi:WD40 repeat protein